MKTACLIFLISLSILFFKPFLAIGAVECAPGDVPLDVKGNVTTPDKGVRCLYGSDIAANKGLGGTMQDPRENIRKAINIALGFLAVLVTIFIIYGGVLWLTSVGNEERVKKGKQTLMWAAIGAVVISIAWTIASYILQVGKSIA